jgi:hypothetical protein
MKKIILFLIPLFSTSVAFSGTDMMPSMPMMKEKKLHVVKSNEEGEDLQDQRGFGDDAPKVRMMNLMMVEGSGYEGMDMSEMSAQDSKSTGTTDHTSHAVQTPSSSLELKSFQPKKGLNVIEFTAKPNLKFTAQVYMTSMDMGTETPRVKEVTPGKYQVKANFTMVGPWALKISGGGISKEFNFEAK